MKSPSRNCAAITAASATAGEPRRSANVVASMRLARENPGTIALWGLIVAAALFVVSVRRDPAHKVPIRDGRGAGL